MGELKAGYSQSDAMISTLIQKQSPCDAVIGQNYRRADQVDKADHCLI